MNNPFTISFGEEPSCLISRAQQTEVVVRSFTNEPPNNRTYILTGVRGSGKTVALTVLSNRFRKDKDWVVVDLNPYSDILQDLASKLYATGNFVTLLKKSKINFSLGLVDAEFETADPVSNMEIAVENMISVLQKKNKKVLIAIDEVTNSQSMRIFVSAFQTFIRKKLPVFLLMTGLPENIDSLQNSASLTFLYRAPKVWLSSLDLMKVAQTYKTVFMFSHDKALEMAKVTKGFPYAFQILGYYTYEMNDDYKAAISECKSYLYHYVYEKIWSEMSEKDKKVVFAAAKCKTDLVKDIRQDLGMDSFEFSPYRARLIKKGLIDPECRGRIVFLLPFFDLFVVDQVDE